MNQSRAIVTGFHAAAPRALKTVAVRVHRLNGPGWAYMFVLSEFACQLALLLPSLGAVRVIVRTFSFLASLAFLVILRRGPKSHPAATFALIALTIVTLETFHPTTNTIAAALATLFLDLAVFGPIFWAPRLKVDVRTVRRMLLIYWSYYVVSAFFGVLQVYFPGRFEPPTSTVMSEAYLQALHITLADGTRILRPQGLTDTPGGAGIGGAFSIIFAFAFLQDRPKLWFRILLLFGVGVACFALYLCQVRALVVMTAISLAATSLPFVFQGRASRFVTMSILFGAIAVIAFSFAVDVGGKAVTGRLSTLTADSAGNVYFSNRGYYLSHLFNTLIPRYPLGAGLGRYGMIVNYFGDMYNPDSRPLFAEIQWHAWLYDGGVPMIVVWTIALVVTLVTAFRLAIRVDDGPGRDLYKLATVLTGYSVGVVALMFDCCPFVTNWGMDFWCLNALIFAAGEQMPAPQQGKA